MLDVLYRTCDIFCLPSVVDSTGVSEGLPVVLIEAMSYGKPVIATRLAGTPELVEDILIEERDVAGLTEALRRLIADPELRQRMGQRNVEIVEAEYSKANVKQMRDLLMRVHGAD
jgi:colanic acid/amylovoran biosynthesis glycosyltransferase